MRAELQPQEVCRIRRIIEFIVGRDEGSLNAELSEPIDEQFWEALESYNLFLSAPPESFDTKLNVSRFDSGAGAIVDAPLWDIAGNVTNVHLTLLIEFVGDLPSISIINLRIP